MEAEEIAREAAFLCARLRDFENDVGDPSAEREFHGHVIPSVARLEASVASGGWQPIETFSDDQNAYLFNTRCRDMEVGRRTPDGEFQTEWGGDFSLVGVRTPTHWMSLPTPPAALSTPSQEHRE